MDMMMIRKMMGQMASGAKIKQVKFRVDSYSQSAVVQLDAKPYAIIVACESQAGMSGINYTVIRYDALWTTYNGGNYVRSGTVVAKSNGNQDHYNNTSSAVWDSENNTITLKATGGYFTSDRDYYMWYITDSFFN